MEEIEHLMSPNYDPQREVYVVKLASEALGKTAEEAKERAKKLLQAYQQAERELYFLEDKPKPLLFGDLYSFNVIVSEEVPDNQIWFATQEQLEKALEYSQKQIEKYIQEKLNG